MDVKNIQNGANAQYDSFLIDALNINKNKEVSKNIAVKSNQTTTAEKTIWQQNVLLNAIDKLENNIQVDKTSPLFSDENAPIESYKEALEELRKIVLENKQEYMKESQANLTPRDILYLFEDQFEFFV